MSHYHFIFPRARVYIIRSLESVVISRRPKRSAEANSIEGTYRYNNPFPA
jgi:hypothetical protein